MPSRTRSLESPHFLHACLKLRGATLDLPLERLFDDLPNVVFFIKDRAGRYVSVNRTLVERCGFADRSEVLGRRPSDLYPAPLAARYERQDQRVVQNGRPVLDQLELHLYPNRRRGWCLTNKYPIRDERTGAVSAVVGLSRDVEGSARGAESRGFPELARALDALHARIADPPGIEELAALCALTSAKFSRLVHRVFGLTPRQLAMKIRLDEALHLLATTDAPLAEIALVTGFCDQSAFTRHFRRLTGLPPGLFRSQSQSQAVPDAPSR
jgi:PAS domain S-box-containing protein